MIGGWFDDPDRLWHETGLGREEFVQKLLSTLVFGGDGHRWNVPGRPSPRGLEYLQRLTAAHFPAVALREARFIDEFELPRRHDDERAGWPDQAVVTDDTLVMVELKTEKRSHRTGQLAYYLDLAVSHHPYRTVYLLYITPAMDVPPPHPTPPGMAYAHASWARVAPIIAEVWQESTEAWERAVADRLRWWLAEVEAQRPPPPRRRPVPAATEVPMADAVEQVLQAAVGVQRSGEQKAVNVWLGSPDGLEGLRLKVREHLRAGATVNGSRLTNVLPWLWTASSSGGRALTPVGDTHGYELRLSRYARELW